MLLHKPLRGTLLLSELDPGDADRMLLFNVLSTIPVHLSNLPSVLSISIAIPIIRTTDLTTFGKHLQALFALPEHDEGCGTVRYSLELKPADIDHKDFSTIQSVKFTSNIRANSWLSTTVSRPTSYVLSWLNPKTTMAASSSGDSTKLKISSPIHGDIPCIMTNDTTPDRPRHQIESLYSAVQTSVVKDHDSAKNDELHAFLDELGLPEDKRKSILKLPLDKRMKLVDTYLESKLGAETTLQPKAVPTLTEMKFPIPSTENLKSISARGREKVNDSQILRIACIPTLFPESLPNPPNEATSVSGTAIDVIASNEDLCRSERPRSRSRSPVRINMSTCPPKLEWNRPKSPIRPEHTGSSWLTSWWQKTDTKTTVDPAESYVSRTCQLTGTTLLTELISLRVHLGTASMTWISTFLTHRGIEMLEDTISRQNSTAMELKCSIISEVLKCFRVLLNCQAGFKIILSSMTVIPMIANVCRTANARTSTMGFDLLAGVCAAPGFFGHHKVFLALSDKSESIQRNRFLWLTVLLTTLSQALKQEPSELVSLSNQLRSLLTLLNALINAWDNVEDRLALRHELLGAFMHIHSSRTAKYYSPEINVQVELLISCASHDRFELQTSITEACHASNEPPIPPDSPVSCSVVSAMDDHTLSDQESYKEKCMLSQMQENTNNYACTGSDSQSDLAPKKDINVQCIQSPADTWKHEYNLAYDQSSEMLQGLQRDVVQSAATLRSMKSRGSISTSMEDFGFDVEQNCIKTFHEPVICAQPRFRSGLLNINPPEIYEECPSTNNGCMIPHQLSMTKQNISETLRDRVKLTTSPDVLQSISRKENQVMTSQMTSSFLKQSSLSSQNTDDSTLR